MRRRSFECNEFAFIAIVLFDEGHKLIWFDETMLFLYGMAHGDISVGLYFRVKNLACMVNVGKKLCRDRP